MLRWIKTGRRVADEGTTTTYSAPGTPYTIESRKRHIPHAGGRPGTWNHTSFFILRNGEELKEKYSLKDAKEYVEQLGGETDTNE